MINHLIKTNDVEHTKGGAGKRKAESELGRVPLTSGVINDSQRHSI